MPDRTLQILWIDDEPHTVAYEEDVLRGLGHAVHWAHDFQAAVAALHTRIYDRIILDQMFPVPGTGPLGGRADRPRWAGASLLWWLRRGEAPQQYALVLADRIAGWEIALGAQLNASILASNRAARVVPVSGFDDELLPLFRGADCGPGTTFPDIVRKPLDIHELLRSLDLRYTDDDL
ncbi:MAG: CheY-like chemotaxis protein [Myxococcota bacterium]|jgi:CheY-like chemotaxis protein